jgi:hypothetical protein
LVSRRSQAAGVTGIGYVASRVAASVKFTRR